MNPYPNLKDIKDIVLLSGSELKRASVEAVTGINPRTIDASNTGNPQPIGYEQAMKCVDARLASIADNIGDFPSEILVVVIENYIEKADGRYTDYAKVCLLYANGLVRVNARSKGVRVPDEYTERVDLMAGAGTPTIMTVGEMIANETGTDCSKDWFKTVDPKNPDRVTQINDALDAALQNLNADLLAKECVVLHDDFPKPGVLFADIFSLTPTACTNLLVRALVNKDNKKKDFRSSFWRLFGDAFVAGPESRGMMLGYSVAAEIGASFVPIRKPGKLPGEIESVEITTEYSSDTLEATKAHFGPGHDHAIIVDDLIATGGSIVGTIRLLKKFGVTKFTVVALTDVAPLRKQWRAAIEAESPGTEVLLAFA